MGFSLAFIVLGSFVLLAIAGEASMNLGKKQDGFLKQVFAGKQQTHSKHDAVLEQLSTSAKAAVQKRQRRLRGSNLGFKLSGVGRKLQKGMMKGGSGIPRAPGAAPGSGGGGGVGHQQLQLREDR